MQSVIWSVEFIDNTWSIEFDSTGKETVFTEILPRKNEMKSISLLVAPTKAHYTINLINGEINLNGTIMRVGKEVDGRFFSFTNLPVVYNDGVIQFKCSMPVSPGESKVYAATYNIGYKIQLPTGMIKYPRTIKGRPISWTEVMYAQPLITIDASTYVPALSLSLTVKQTDVITGVETLIRL